MRVVVIGGGPAGLTAGYEVTKFNLPLVVLEKGNVVGGLARTESYKGFHFDIGGHRFFTKVEGVQKMWRDVLGGELLRRPRLSRIYYNGRFFFYPLRPLNALLALGLWQGLLMVLSYLRWQLFPYRREDTFEQWVTNRFGRRLFRTFFKTYTEKVWGISCSELRAEWAAQRIKDLSLKTVLLSMFIKPKTTIKTLIEEFDYPRHGPGMMWNAVKDEILRRGGVVQLNSEVVRIKRAGNRIEGVFVRRNGSEEMIQGTDFISSMPITQFIKALDPPAPPTVVSAADRLTYRDFLTVVLIAQKPHIFDDNWIYIHDPGVHVARIQNFKNWSPDMVPNPDQTSLGLEYFCNQGDALWSMRDAELVELGRREVERIGLARSEEIGDGCVVRVERAYPVYDSDYREVLGVVREFVNGLENCQSIGRNGLHRYNNQDHAMLTGMLAVRNLVLGQRNDLWSVNTHHEYHEEIREQVTEHDPEEVLGSTLPHAVFKLDRVALGLSMGVVGGTLLLLATLALVLKGGAVVGPNLGLLREYFPGYSVTAPGSVLGLFYGFGSGFVIGWTVAFFRNAMVFLYTAIVHRRAELLVLRRLLEYL